MNGWSGLLTADLFKLVHVLNGPFFCGMCFISTQTRRTGGEVIAFVMALCSQIEKHILLVRFMNQRATVNIHSEQRQESMAAAWEWEEVHCSIISQFNRVVLNLRSCYSWIDLPHKPPSVWFVAQAMQLGKHWRTLEGVGGWQVVLNDHLMIMAKQAIR